MSDWVGPGLYRIESYKDRGVAIAVKDGKNVVLKTNQKDEADQENQWVFALAGTSLGKEEFFIINRSTGLHLTCAEGSKQAPLTVTHDSPTFYRCRWNIAPTLNNTGAFFIVPVKDNSMRLVTEGESTADNAKLQIWKGPVGAKGTWWYLEAVAPSELLCANVGAAPKP